MNDLSHVLLKVLLGPGCHLPLQAFFKRHDEGKALPLRQQATAGWHHMQEMQHIALLVNVLQRVLKRLVGACSKQRQESLIYLVVTITSAW